MRCQKQATHAVPLAMPLGWLCWHPISALLILLAGVDLDRIGLVDHDIHDDGLTADLTVLHVRLLRNGRIHQDGDDFRAVGAVNILFYQIGHGYLPVQAGYFLR